jgi:hypothetical protein
MAPADSTGHLRRAAQARHEATTARAEAALRQMHEAGQPVTFRGVAEAAGVSRAWLYRQPALRGEIDRLRSAHPAASHPQHPAPPRGSEESRQRRIEALLEDNTRLRAENTRLHRQVAVLLGERRTHQTHGDPAAPAQPQTS